MNYIFKTGIYFIIFLYSISSINAFQHTTSNALELPQELKLKKKKAETLANEGAWEEAILAYKTIQQECLDLNLEQLAIDLYQNLLEIIVIREDLEKMDKRVLIEAIKHKEKNARFEAIYYGALAHLSAFYNDVDSLDFYYDKACFLYQKDNRFTLEGYFNVTLANEFYYLDDLQVAQNFLKKAELILEKKLKPRNLDLPSIYNVQTSIYYGLDEYDKALKSNLIRISLLEKTPSIYLLDLAYEYNNLATIYSSLKDYNNSLDYYLKALNIIESSDNYSKTESATLICNIASTHLKLENFKEAKEASLKSISYLDLSNEKNKDILGDYINNYHQLFSCYNYFEQLDSSEYYLKKALDLNQNFPYRITTTYINYSNLFLAQKKYSDAKKYALKSITKGLEAYGTKSEFISGAYNILSDINRAQNNYEEALTNTQKALETISINFSNPKGVENPELIKVLNKGELLSTLRRKLTILKQLYQQESPLVTADNIFATAKLIAEALEQMNRKMKNINSKRDFLTKQAIPSFEAAISSALYVADKTGNKEYINEAFMLSERSKSMLMADAMQGAMASTLGGIPDSLLRKLDELQEALANAEKQRFDAKNVGDSAAEKEADALVFDAKHQLNLLEHNLEEQYPKYQTLKMKSSVASVTDIQGTLDSNTTFIEYFEGDSSIYAFVITKYDVSVSIIPKEKNFKFQVLNFQKSLMNIDAFYKQPGLVYNTFIQQSHDFYQKLVEPILQKNQTKRLLIIPDGVLSYLPFEVLLQESIPLLKQGTNEGVDFSKLPYLIRDYTISYNYSGTMLIAQQAKKEPLSDANILALAPSYTSTISPDWREKRILNLRKLLVDLPGAVDEVSDLEGAYLGQFYYGKEATEAVFKKEASTHGVLHLAMHGWVDQKNPEYSGLILTENQTKDEDNILYSYEIKQLELQAKLVVLSACETGLGKYQRGEGVVSIGRSFMYAGVPSLLMTLWSLNDHSGSVIIEQFYKNLSEGMEKDEAIRQAKLYYLDNQASKYAHPYMWAAFVQVGDYSNIKINSKSYWNYYIIGTVVFLLVLLLTFFKTRKKA